MLRKFRSFSHFSVSQDCLSRLPGDAASSRLLSAVDAEGLEAEGKLPTLSSKRPEDQVRVCMWVTILSFYPLYIIILNVELSITNVLCIEKNVNPL